MTETLALIWGFRASRKLGKPQTHLPHPPRPVLFQVCGLKLVRGEDLLSFDCPPTCGYSSLTGHSLSED